jgi:pimeloyl-ACP methyl ester carboxylesterase
MHIFLWILIIFIILVLILDRLVERMYRHDMKKHSNTPAKFQIAFDEIYIPSVQDTQLYGWWMPTFPDAPTLILVHGWGRNLERMLAYIRALHPMGYNLLAFDARNHGSSSPVKHPTVGTFSEDILAVVDFIAKSGWVSNDRIGIVGLSVGGGAAINAASWDQRVKAVITVGAFSHPIEVMSLEFKKRKVPAFIASFLFGYIRLRFGINFDKIAPVNNIRNSNADILLIHGNEDETIPLAQGQALVKAGHSEKTQLWIVPDKGHSNCDSHPQFWEKAGAFLQRALPVP